MTTLGQILNLLFQITQEVVSYLLETASSSQGHNKCLVPDKESLSSWALLLFYLVYSAAGTIPVIVGPLMSFFLGVVRNESKCKE